MTSAMPPAVERFLTAAAPAGIVVTPRAFGQPTRTAAEAAAAVGCELGQIVKSLVLVDPDGAAVLALTAGSNRLDLAAAATASGAVSLRMGNADQVRAATGFAIGGTPPFGHPAPLTTVLDTDLLAFDEVWAAAGTPEHVFPIAPGDLVRITAGTVHTLAA